MKEWSFFLDALEAKHPGTKQNWQKNYKITNYNSQNLYLSFSDIFSLNFFKEHIGPHLKDFKNSNNHLIKVHLELQNTTEKNSKMINQITTKFEFPIDESITFDQFIVTPDNAFPVDLIKNALANTTSFNPLFLYGAKACGKSHLLQAAYNFYKQQGLNCLYVDAEKFSEHVVYAMKNSLMLEFRKIYRHIDMLFFDNVQHLGGKNATQEEFFHTFNTLHMTGKTLVLSADSPASLLKNIEQRLISRFEWGLSIELPLLDKNYYGDLIDKMKKRLGLDITSDHKNTLENHFSNNPSQISNALHAMVLRSHLDNNRSQTHLQNTLEDLKNTKPELTFDMILNSSSKFFNLKAKDIKGSSQIKPLSYPRQITMFLIRKHLNMPYKKIGELFKRDHSTVMASITIIEEKLKNLDEETLNAIKRIEWELKH